MNKMLTAFQSRCNSTCEEEFDHRFTELLIFMKNSGVQEDQQAKQIVMLTEKLQEKIEGKELSKALLDELVTAAGKAIKYQQKIKNHIMAFYDQAESRNQFYQMTLFAQSLEITPEDTLKRDRSSWMIYSMDQCTMELCERFGENNATLDSVLDKIEESPDELKNIEKMKQRLEVADESKESFGPV